MRKQKVYIVRFGQGFNQPESYILGLYPTAALANARLKVVTDDGEDGGFDPNETWIDIIEVGPNGVDCFLSSN